MPDDTLNTDMRPAILRRRLLAWYDRERRVLPWRAAPGEAADPYRVWASEIMLQQTTAAAVAPYFARFVARWPTVADLAAAELDEVLHAWQGLGYYARARNLHACARAVVAAGGTFPASEDELRRLPGIGAYTAAAIAAIAFARKATPVDGNVLRVIARLDAIETPLPLGRALIEARARALTPERRAGDFAQALMDLGATVCTPRRPRCEACPWQPACAAYASGAAARYPLKAARKDRPLRHGVAFWLTRPGGLVFLRKRPPTGLLGGMMEIPSSPWRAAPWDPAEALAQAAAVAPERCGEAVRWQALPGSIGHTFTHFHLELTVLAGRMASPADPAIAPAGQWVRADRLDAHALPTVMKKIARHALGEVRLSSGDRPA